jgi:small-conductance mechanosensitive channel
LGWIALTAGFSSLAAAPDDDRATVLMEQVRTLETVVGNAKDASEKTRLEDKLARLRQELKILQDREALEARERALQTNRTGNTLDRVRDKLRNLDVSADEAQARLAEIGRLRRQAANDRETLASQLEDLRAQKDAAADRVVDLEERLATKGEELRALALERETSEAQDDLAREADQLRARIKAADLLADRPTLRGLFDAYTRVQAQRKAGTQLDAEASDLGQKLQVSQDTLELSRQKLAKFDEELALLEKQTGFFRRDPRIEKLLAQQRSQKAALGARVPFLARQVEAIKHRQQALGARQELATLHTAFEDENFARLKNAYWQRLRWPLLAFGALSALQLLGSLLLLPVFFRKESLFLARRLTRYAFVLFASGILAGFLFDDLSMIAATLGIVSAALVISLQDVCTSMFGWLVIMVSGKFGIGDRLEIDGTRGDVLDIQLLRTTLLEINGWLGTDQPTGRVITVPNNFIFKSKVFNFTHGHPFIWGKIDVTVTYSTPIASALALFQRVLEEETREQFTAARKAALSMQRRYGVEDADYQPKIHTHIADSGVTLTLFYVAHYREFSKTRNRINRRLIAEIETHPHVQLAYNTLTVLRSEAKAEAPSAVLGADLTTPPFRASAVVIPRPAE